MLLPHIEFIHFYSFIHLVIKRKILTESQSETSKKTCENSNLWETLVVFQTHTRYKHEADGCMLSVIPIQNCQADEKKKSAALSNCGVSRQLKLTRRPTEYFSPEYKIVTK